MPSERGSDLETLIRDVLTGQADRAPHRATVLAGVRWSRAHRGNRRLAMVAAGVTVVLAAIGIPLGLHLTSRPAAPVPPANVRIGRQPPDIPLPYRVDWLPPGYVVALRSAEPGGDHVQRWEPADHSGPYIEVDDYARPPHTPRPPGAHFVVIGGFDCWYVTTQQQVMLVYEAGGHSFHVTVAGVVDQVDVAEDVARQTQAMNLTKPDTVPQMLTFGELPTGFQAAYLTVQGTSPTSWTVTRTADGPSDGDVAAALSTTQPSVTHQQSVRVRGRPGWFGPLTDDPIMVAVVVRLDGGWLTVHAKQDSLTVVQLTAIADGVGVYPDTNLSWLGD